MHRIARDRAGNTMALFAAALIPLLAMIGGAVDMGRGYLAQSRLQQACDAGVLATRKRLGTQVAVDDEIPEEAEVAGERFFNQNFRAGAYGTVDRDFTMSLEQSYAISGRATANVPTSVMGVFGFEGVPVAVECSAQISMSNVDLMLVLDVTGSMMQSNPGDTKPRIDVMKDVVRRFHAQMEANKGSRSRVRYGFVPYSTNVNVGGLLDDDWMVDQWTYQSRRLVGTGTAKGTYSFYTARSPVSGSRVDTVDSTYPANGGGNCKSPPSNKSVTTYVQNATRTEPFDGPPAGTRTITNFHSTVNGDEYAVRLRAGTCTVIKSTYTNYVWTFDYITQPALISADSWSYEPVSKNVSNWRTDTDGCIEERDTYEITDFANVDLTRALDLDIDLVPTPGDQATQWRPQYPEMIYGRAMEWSGGGKFDPKIETTTKEFISPHAMYTDACPAPARKLAEMTDDELDSYLGTINALGSTYHDIGMLWGARLISPTGLFADENADVSTGDVTNRNIIFMTDGQTSTLDVAYSAYGMEPVDRRRWTPGSAMTLTDTSENRFAFACAEARKRNVTVWLIAFGTMMNPMFEECAGPGHAFQADNADELAESFNQIANQISDLRITR